MFPKLITALIVLVMIIFSFSPLNFGSFYLLFRPLVQPYATEHIMLFPGIPLTGVFPVVLIFYSALTCAFRGGYKVTAPNVIPLYILLFFSTVSFLNTMDYTVSIGHVIKIGTAVALYVLLYSAIKTTGDAKKVLYALVLTSIIPMLFGYYQFVTHTAHRGLWGGTRIDGLLGQYNAYGEFLCLSFLATLMILLQRPRRSERIFLICIMASMIVSMILALNRGSWIGLSAGLFFAYFGYRNHIKARWFVLAGALIAILFSGLLVERFMELGETTSWGASKNTFSGRVEFWKKIMTLIPSHPLTGFGIGTANLVTGKFLKTTNVPHNDYLRLALEVGIVGALLYIIFLLRELFFNIKLLFDKRNWFINYPMLAAVIYWIMLSTTQNIIYNVAIFPMFMALIAVSRKWNELTSLKEPE